MKKTRRQYCEEHEDLINMVVDDTSLTLACGFNAITGTDPLTTHGIRTNMLYTGVSDYTITTEIDPDGKPTVDEEVVIIYRPNFTGQLPNERNVVYRRTFIKTNPQFTDDRCPNADSQSYGPSLDELKFKRNGENDTISIHIPEDDNQSSGTPYFNKGVEYYFGFTVNDPEKASLLFDRNFKKELRDKFGIDDFNITIAKSFIEKEDVINRVNECLEALRKE